jgi:hypothetical protein
VVGRRSAVIVESTDSRSTRGAVLGSTSRLHSPAQCNQVIAEDDNFSIFWDTLIASYEFATKNLKSFL